VRSNSID